MTPTSSSSSPSCCWTIPAATPGQSTPDSRGAAVRASGPTHTQSPSDVTAVAGATPRPSDRRPGAGAPNPWPVLGTTRPSRVVRTLDRLFPAMLPPKVDTATRTSTSGVYQPCARPPTRTSAVIRDLPSTPHNSHALRLRVGTFGFSLTSPWSPPSTGSQTGLCATRSPQHPGAGFVLRQAASPCARAHICIQRLPVLSTKWIHTLFTARPAVFMSPFIPGRLTRSWCHAERSKVELDVCPHRDRCAGLSTCPGRPHSSSSRSHRHRWRARRCLPAQEGPFMFNLCFPSICSRRVYVGVADTAAHG